MNRALTKTVGACGIALLSIVGYAGPAASAQGRGTTQVAGLLEPDQNGSCTGNPNAAGGAYDVSGGLVGCWYVDTFIVDHESNDGGFVSHGTETFDGCLGNNCGRFFTTYTFTAKFEGTTEKHGRCHHDIVGGDGGFTGASGEIEMHDLPNGCAEYRGQVSI